MSERDDVRLCDPMTCEGYNGVFVCLFTFVLLHSATTRNYYIYSIHHNKQLNIINIIYNFCVIICSSIHIL